MPSSLYIHIPFCVKRCVYCDFVSGVYDSGKADAYIQALKKEIDTIPAETVLSTLYIGGGTPTVLAADLLEGLIDHIFSHFRFEDNYEATIEANPGTVTGEKLYMLRSGGLNRISIGIQSFNNMELSFLGRIHTAEEAAHTVHLARDAGFENLGIDLIYGIPGQDMQSWKMTLEKAAGLKPEHISTYELTVEEGTDLYEMHKEDIKQGSDEDTIIAMYEHAIDYLTAQGYIHYEISNFAKPGFFSGHNLNYWDRGDYYGTGPGAHSFVRGRRFFNTADLNEYIRLVSKNCSPLKDSEEISDEKALSEAIFLGLRKTEGINIEPLARRYMKNILTLYEKEIKELQDAGLIELGTSDCSYETNIKLTRKGLLLSNEVFEKFLRE